MSWLADRRAELAAAVDGVRNLRDRRREIARNLAMIADLETRAVRITQGPGGRCFDMGEGNLLRIAGEQPANTTYLYMQYVLPITTMDAEDFYGWTPADA